MTKSWRARPPSVGENQMKSSGQPSFSPPVEPTSSRAQLYRSMVAIRFTNSASHRPRCTWYHREFGHLLAPETLLLLCDRKPLETVKMMSSMAEAGDEHARFAVALLGNVGGSCDVCQDRLAES